MEGRTDETDFKHTCQPARIRGAAPAKVCLPATRPPSLFRPPILPADFFFARRFFFARKSLVESSILINFNFTRVKTRVD